MWRRKNNNPPSPPPPVEADYIQVITSPDDPEYLRAKLHYLIEGMDEYLLRTLWGFLSMFYPNDPDAHRR